MGETMGNNHCGAHEGNCEKLKEHGGSITDLYDKHNEAKDILTEIKIAIATMAVKMESGFNKADRDIKDLACDIKKMNEQRDATIKYYDTVVADVRASMVKMEEQVKELKDFQWFRDWMNSARNNLPKAIFWLILSVFGAMVLIHQLDLTRFFRGK